MKRKEKFQEQLLIENQTHNQKRGGSPFNGKWNIYIPNKIQATKSNNVIKLHHLIVRVQKDTDPIAQIQYSWLSNKNGSNSQLLNKNKLSTV